MDCDCWIEKILEFVMIEDLYDRVFSRSLIGPHVQINIFPDQDKVVLACRVLSLSLSLSLFFCLSLLLPQPLRGHLDHGSPSVLSYNLSGSQCIVPSLLFSQSIPYGRSVFSPCSTLSLPRYQTIFPFASFPKQSDRVHMHGM